MPKHNAQGFNKEKLLFLATAGIFAGGVYYFMISAPVSLPDDPKPISTKVAAPAPLSVPSLDIRPLAYYVEPGKNSHLLDSFTHEPVNRDRKTPFAPEAGFAAYHARGGDLANGGKGSGKQSDTPPPPKESKKNEKEGDKDKPTILGPHDPRAQVAFMGVIILNDETYGLLRPKDGSAPLRVKLGDEIPDLKYKVTKIEKQAIWVKDAKDCAFILRDTDEDTASADKKKASDDEDDADDDTVAPAKEQKKPAFDAKKGKPDAGAQDAGEAKPRPQPKKRARGPNRPQ